MLGDPEFITGAPRWELRSASPSDNDTLARVAIGGFTNVPDWGD